MIETVLLDAGGVLVFPNWDRVSDIFKAHGVDVSADALRAAEPQAKFTVDTTYGAAAKGTIMLNFLNLNARVIEYAVDRNAQKHGKYVPGVRVPIADPERLKSDRPDYVMILPWNFRDEIIRQQQDFLRAGGRFVVPIPDLSIVSE